MSDNICAVRLRADLIETSCLRFSKQSFDRFGDDLCQVILSFLSISNKLKFECVSKQWQRLIFNKQTKLRISNIRSDDTMDSLVERKTSRYDRVRMRALETVLQKFKLINEILIDGRVEFHYEVLEVISKHCDYLQKVSIRARYISRIPKKCLIAFGQKCAKKLLSLRLDGIDCKNMSSLLRVLPNLKSLTVEKISTIIDGKNDSSVVLPKLEEIQFCRCDLVALKQFSKCYGASIKSIRSHLLTLDLRGGDLVLALIELSQFCRLESIDLFIDVCDSGSDLQSIDDGIKQIALKCKQLKRFTFTMDGNLIKKALFHSFGHFCDSLIDCEINIISDSELSDYSGNYGTIASFGRMTNLANLSLDLEELTDEHLIDIDKHLPQLRTIRMNSSKRISDKTLNLLANIKTLNKIDITSYTTDSEHNITDQGITNIIKNCFNIKSMSFDQKNENFDFHITKNSLEMIIERAKSRPNCKYNFSYAVNKSDETSSEQNKHDRLLGDLPFNLSVEII